MGLVLVACKPNGPTLPLLPFPPCPGDTDTETPAPVTLWGVARLRAPVTTPVLSLAGGRAHQRRELLQEQARRLRGRAHSVTEEVTHRLHRAAHRAALQIFVASYHCPHHQHRSGPREGPGACQICHPATPLSTGVESLHLLSHTAMHTLIQSHLAELILDEADSPPPQDPLVPMCLDWFSPTSGPIPASPSLAREEERRPPLAPRHQPTASSSE